MMKYYITFAGQVYDRTVQRIAEDAPKLGVDKVIVYDDLWLTKQEFYERNKFLWDPHPICRGFGWYCWKPFIIQETLKHASVGDIVLYTDADTYPVRDLSPLYRICGQKGIMLFEASAWMHREWCKRDCYVVMGLDQPQYHRSKAGCARFMLFEKGPWLPRQFLFEWQTYCLNLRANSLDKSVLLQEFPSFQEHRSDQSILTLLAHKYNIKLHREADQSGDGHANDRELFQTLFHQSDDWGRAVTSVPVGSRFRNV